MTEAVMVGVHEGQSCVVRSSNFIHTLNSTFDISENFQKSDDLLQGRIRLHRKFRVEFSPTRNGLNHQK